MIQPPLNYRQDAISYMCYPFAIDAMGVYPASVKGGDNPYEKRTERMEGYNEAMREINHKAIAIEDYLENLQSPFKEEVEEALLDRSIYISFNKDQVCLNVLCSDTFCFACADSEEIKPEEIFQLRDCQKLTGKYGEMLWACRKRNMKPLKEWFKHFNKTEKQLFNAIGEGYEYERSI